MNNMKIMMIQPSIYMHGGAERQIVNMANYFAEHNHKVTIFTSKAVPEFKRDLKDVRILEAKTFNGLMQWATEYSSKYNIVNPHNHPAQLVCCRFKANTIWQCNEPPTEILKGGKISDRERSLIQRHIKKAVVISNFDKKRFKDIYGFTPIVNYPGVRHEYFSQDIKKVEDVYGTSGLFTIIQSGYLVWTKNQVKTVEIFKEFSEQVPDSKLILAGYDGSPYAKKVKAKIKELDLVGDVIITGYLKNDSEMLNLYKLSDVHVAPLLHQGGWATVFESVCTGIPLLVSKKFVASDLVENNKLGTVTTPDKFIDELVKIYNNIDNEKANAVKASKWIQENLTWEKFNQKYLDIFDEVMESG